MRVGFARVWWQSCYVSIHRNIAAIRLRRPRELVFDNDDDDEDDGTHETNLHDVPRPSSSPWYSIQDNDAGIWYRLKEYAAGWRPS